MEIVNKRGDINLNKWMEKAFTPMVSLNGVAGLFGASACIVQVYSLTCVKAYVQA
jgi:hypothetical protein